MAYKNLLFLMGMLVCVQAKSQTSSKALQVEQYQLNNGLKIYLNYDESVNSVMGAIVVKGGGKRDPKDATGVAHYFEHIMFKGSERLGTVNYEQEKVFLDSIANFYEQLGNTQDKEERKEIQIQINRLSLKAADFAIPNEFDRVIASMGGEHTNAYTSYDEIVYLNSFPGSAMEKWLEVYSDRFESPVFRLFQSELETVYEEKNMYSDHMFGPFTEKLIEVFFGGTPYGDQQLIGAAEHLKNPSLKRMSEYFETYYVPNNMALVLSGNFNVPQTKALINDKFGHWQAKPLPKHEPIQLTPIQGRVQLNDRLTPVRVQILCFQTVPETHPDFLTLEICAGLLSNSSLTGLLDQLLNDNRLLEASAESVAMGEVGVHVGVAIPKLIGQSFANAEQLVLQQIDSLKQGKFNDELLEGVKTELVKSKAEGLENIYQRANMLCQVFSRDLDWNNDVLNYEQRLRAIDKEEILRVANKYYGNNYKVFRSRMGFPKRDKVDKPPFKPIEAKNKNTKSDYYKEIDSIESIDATPEFIVEGEDFHQGSLFKNARYYHTENPINQFFTLTLKFNYPQSKYPEASLAAYILEYCGTKELSFEELSKKFQSLGTSIYFNSTSNTLDIELKGEDKHLREVLSLLNVFMSEASLKPEQKKTLLNQYKAVEKMSKKDAGTLSEALEEYALYQEESKYLNAPVGKDVKAMTSESMQGLTAKVLGQSCQIHYVGQAKPEEFATIAKQELQCLENLSAAPDFFYREKKEPAENTIYFLENKQAIQSQLSIFIPSNSTTSAQERMGQTLFNHYFGGAMNSILFQELREFKSLAYGVSGRFEIPLLPQYKGWFRGSMTTQSDKTCEALAAFTNLLEDMPQYPERMESIKQNMKLSINGKRPPFRQLTNRVPYWKYYGAEQDPYIKLYNSIDESSFEQLVDFYQKNIEGRKMIITIVGDKSRIDMKALSQYGKVVEVNKKQLFK